MVEELTKQVCSLLLNQRYRVYLHAFTMLLMGALAPQLLLPGCLSRPWCRLLFTVFLTAGLLAMAGLLVLAEVLEAREKRLREKPETVERRSVEDSAWIDAWLDKAIALADGMEGPWRDEGQELTTNLSSKDMGTRFPAFRGIVEASGDSLRKRAPGAKPPTAEEVFAVSVSFTGRQLSDPYRATDTTLQRLGPHAWLSFQTWTGNYIQSPQAGLFVQAVRRTSSGSCLPRLTSVTVPAPAELSAAHADQVQKLEQGQTFKNAATLLSMVDVQALPDGGIRVCNLLHVDPHVPRLVPSNIVQGFIKSVPCRGAAYLDMALHLQLPLPLTPQGPLTQARQDTFEEVTINGRTCEVSRLLAGVVKDQETVQATKR